MSRFSDSINTLRRTLQSVAGETVEIDQTPLTAIPGMTRYKQETSTGQVRINKVQDFIFEQEELNEKAITIVRGTQIVWKLRTFEAVSATGKETEFSDPHKTLVRVHTQEVTT